MANQTLQSILVSVEADGKAEPDLTTTIERPLRPGPSQATSIATSREAELSPLEIDGITSEMLLSFVAEDVEDFLTEHPEASDLAIAYMVYQEELQIAQRLWGDRKMALSESNTSPDNQQAIGEALAVEQQARRDREIARGIRGADDLECGNATNAAREAAISLETGMDNLTSTLKRLDIDHACHHEHSDTSHSSTPMTVCCACDDHHPQNQTIRNACGHDYCKECIADLFHRSSKDEQLFPPRCCREPLSLDEARRFLTRGFFAHFEEKRIEFTTPNRTYCSNRTCSIFVKPEYIDGRTARCSKCLTKTCTACKNCAHDGACPDDEAIEQIREIARAEGWQQCPQCKHMVSITHGCNHMTCICKAEWCYECGSLYDEHRQKSCACDIWHNDRLLAAATEGVAARPGNRANNAQQVMQRIAALREHHDCEHRRTRYISKPARCEECHHFMRQFIRVCVTCDRNMCARCAQELRNRM